MENKATMTNSTFQTTIEDTTYNGWENYETWNVALWIQNDEGLYNLARRSYSYQDFVRRNFEEGATTLDGVKWDDVNLNLVELDEMLEELWFWKPVGELAQNPLKITSKFAILSVWTKQTSALPIRHSSKHCATCLPSYSAPTLILIWRMTGFVKCLRLLQTI